MRLGILSDSHGRADTTARAVQALVDAGAESIIHLGDLETTEVIDALAGHAARIVFGNCDWDAESLARHARSVGVSVDDPMGMIDVDGRRLAFTHGHRPDLMRAAMEEGVDYLLHGHTHELHDERIGSLRLINPGALFRAPRYTVMVLDPAIDSVRVIEIPKEDREPS